MLTESELADRFGVEPGTLRNWRSSGKGPSFLKMEGTVRYRLDDVEAYERESLKPSEVQRLQDHIKQLIIDRQALRDKIDKLAASR